MFEILLMELSQLISFLPSLFTALRAQVLPSAPTLVPQLQTGAFPSEEGRQVNACSVTLLHSIAYLRIKYTRYEGMQMLPFNRTIVYCVKFCVRL